jgi:2-keto-3-deoxy-L-rhamnonate aldolase RhmA
LVRVASSKPEHILNALDGGAAGVILPHISSPDEARFLVKACYYGAGGRGYAGSTRAAAFTTQTMAENIEAAKNVVVIAQIEDIQAVEAIDEIMNIQGIDAYFIGRADLTLALGASSQDDPRVIAAVETICAAGVRHDRTLGMFLAQPKDTAYWRQKGASLFLLESDQNFILNGARQLMKTVAEAST